MKIPIIGIGGITTAEDALEFMIVGASLVQVGTALFISPNAGVEIVQGIESYLEANRIGDITELIGTLDTSMAPSLVAAGW